MIFSARKKGLNIKSHKTTEGMSVMPMTLPELVRIPMTQGKVPACRPAVQPKDKVFVGTLIGTCDEAGGVPVHSSVSGTVISIEELPSQLGGSDLHVVIKTDGRQTRDESVKPPVIESGDDLLKAARNCGLVGLGGSGVSAETKMSPDKGKINTLIVNGTECEPFVTSDHINMNAYAREVAAGTLEIQKRLGIESGIIAAREDDSAVPVLEELCKSLENTRVETLPGFYPAGEETLLIRELCGLRLNEGSLPRDAGVLVLNVSTVIKLQQYLITGMPLVSRTITVDGDVLERPMNLEVPIGTPIEEVLKFCGADFSAVRKIIAGGPMTGSALPSASFHTIKTNNALLCFSAYRAERDRETACINCGRCMESCPEGLMPALLFKAWRKRDEETLKRGLLFSCTLCGCCSYVCPARKQLSFELGLAQSWIKKNAKAEGGNDER